jgi:hypothetical protein
MRFQNVLASVIVIWLMHAEKLSDYARHLFNTSQFRTLTRTANWQRNWITPKCMASILPKMRVFSCSATDFSGKSTLGYPWGRTCSWIYNACVHQYQFLNG